MSDSDIVLDRGPGSGQVSEDRDHKQVPLKGASKKRKLRNVRTVLRGPLAGDSSDEDEATLATKVLGSAYQPPVDDGHTSSSDSGPEEQCSKRMAVWQDPHSADLVPLPATKPLPSTLHNQRQLARSTDMAGDTVLSEEQYEARLRHAHTKSTLALAGSDQTPVWAQLGRSLVKTRKPRATHQRFSDSSDNEAEQTDSDSGDEAAQSLAQSTGNYIRSTVHLPHNTIAFKRLRDLTYGHRIRRRINNVEFHPTAPVALVAGEAQKLSLYKIDGDENDILQSAVFEGFPVTRAQLLRQGAVHTIIAGSKQQPYLYEYNMSTNQAHKIQINTKALSQTRRKMVHQFQLSADGSTMAVVSWDGLIHLFSTHSYEWTGSLKQNAEVTAVCFSRAKPERMYSHSADGQVRVWDVRNRACVRSFYDDGCVTGTSITESDDARWLAAGSSSGIVNVYEVDGVVSSAQPVQVLHTIPNLHTAADLVAFNHNAELLVSASSVQENAVRLWHSRSATTHDNFPGRLPALGQVTAAAFSPNGAFALLGNALGRAMIYKLHHYEQY